MQGIITDPKYILEELLASQVDGSVVGIWAPSVGEGMNVCVVHNVSDDEVEHDKLIILKERDLNGIPLQSHVLFLQEIEKVFSFRTLYSDPAYIEKKLGYH